MNELLTHYLPVLLITVLIMWYLLSGRRRYRARTAICDDERELAVISAVKALARQHQLIAHVHVPLTALADTKLTPRLLRRFYADMAPQEVQFAFTDHQGQLICACDLSGDYRPQPPNALKEEILSRCGLPYVHALCSSDNGYSLSELQQLLAHPQAAPPSPWQTPDDLASACTRRQYLLNVSENRLLRRHLQPLAERHGLQVCCQTRLASLLEARGSRALQAIDKKSVDFVITDDQLHPLVLIELDGPHHRLLHRRRADRVKNRAVRQARLPLIRFKNYGRCQEHSFRRAFRRLDRALAAAGCA